MKAQKILLFIFVSSVFVYVCWQIVWYVTCHSPVPEAASVIQQHGSHSGYEMRGFIGQITSEPNQIGGCEVRIEFCDFSTNQPKRTMIVEAKRSWALAPWFVTDVNEKPIP